MSTVPSHLMVALADQSRLSLIETVALPSAVSACARSAGCSESFIVRRALGDSELQAFIRNLCQVGAQALGGSNVPV